jgi:hypothetical protein
VRGFAGRGFGYRGFGYRGFGVGGFRGGRSRGGSFGGFRGEGQPVGLLERPDGVHRPRLGSSPAHDLHLLRARDQTPAPQNESLSRAGVRVVDGQAGADAEDGGAELLAVVDWSAKNIQPTLTPPRAIAARSRSLMPALGSVSASISAGRHHPRHLPAGPARPAVVFRPPRRGTDDPDAPVKAAHPDRTAGTDTATDLQKPELSMFPT